MPVMHGFAESVLESALGGKSASGGEAAEEDEDEEYVLHVNQ